MATHQSKHSWQGELPALIIGGAYNGKSDFIVEQLPRDKKALFIGTADPMEQSFAFRLKELKERRPDHWTTIEETQRITSAILDHHKDFDFVVVDSLNQWLAAEMLRMAPGLTVEQLYEKVRELYHRFGGEILSSETLRQKLILVTSEVSFGIAPQEPTARIFRQSIAEMNRFVASKCTSVLQLTVGIPTRLR